jgi:wobble nucleotide-excising tRNase
VTARRTLISCKGQMPESMRQHNPRAQFHDVLSESEQTCVALAAFLTEPATAGHRSALVFDDPVSSLNHKWRESVALRLVGEADSRQIIVFTYDLVFLNGAKDAAVQKGKTAKLVSLSRIPAGAGTVRLGLPSCAWTAAEKLRRMDTTDNIRRVLALAPL